MSNPPIIEVLFEGGITVQPASVRFRLLHIPGASGPEFPSLSAVGKALGVRPVVIVQDYKLVHPVELLLCLDPSKVYGLQITDLEQCAFRANLDFDKVQHMTYMLLSLAYHSVELCRAYRDTCAVFVTRPLEWNREPIVTFQGPTDAYLEFDALVTAARRAYDSLRYLLWKYFGPKKGSVPSSFPRTLAACVSLPDSLAVRLATSWRTCGELVTAYRDCIQHYCPVGLGLTEMWMTRAPIGVWSTSARIPDNPSARSQRGFTYGQKLDALTFGWESANEILDVAALVVGEAANVIAASNGDTQRV